MVREGCGTCRIALRPIFNLGDPRGTGALERRGTNRVTRDSRGNVIVANGGPRLWVFDSEGRFLRALGEGGDIPARDASFTGVLVGRGDSVYVFDPRHQTMTTYSPAYRFVRTTSLEFGVAASVVSLGDRFVANRMVPSPERIGLPLHLISFDGRVLRSFGSESGFFRADFGEVLEIRALAPDDAAVWAGWTNQYLVERWDIRGERTQVVRRDVDWFEPWWRSQTDFELPPSPRLTAIQVQGDTLWVMVRIAASGWRAGIRRVDETGRRYVVHDRDKYQDAIVEALDLTTGEVLGSSRFPQILYGFIGPGLVFGASEDALGNPIVPIWELQLIVVRTPQPNGGRR